MSEQTTDALADTERPPDEPVTILQLQSANVKGLRVVQITPDRNVVTIGGKNGAGKTSCLDSIEWALGGARAISGKPVRDGQRRAKTVVTLTNGLVSTRTYDAATGATKLVVTKDGVELRSPQAILDAIYGDLTFDPSAFEREKPKDQAATIRRLAGIDTTELDARRKEAFDGRKDAKRTLAKLEAQLVAAPYHPGAPPAEESVAKLAQQLEGAHATIRANDELRFGAKRQADQMGERVNSLTALQVALCEAREEVVRLEIAVAEKAESNTKHKVQADMASRAAASLVDPDLAPIKAKLANVEATNAQVRANAHRNDIQSAVTRTKMLVQTLAATVAGVDAERDNLLEAANFPVPGLGFDWNGVTLNGVPLEQASSAERLRVSVAIGLALNPKLRVMLIRDGSKFDEDGLRLVAEMARDADAQVWIEVVARNERDLEDCSVVIEDGMVRPMAVEDAAE